MMLKNTKKKENAKSPKKFEEIENPKNEGSLHANDVLGHYVESNMKNVEPKSAKLDECILKRVEPNTPSSLREHFYSPQVSPRSCFDIRPIPCDVKFELNLDYVDILLTLLALKIIISLLVSLRRCVYSLGLVN